VEIKIGNTAVVDPQDALIHNALHHTRLIEIHINLRHHEAGGQQGEEPVFFQVLQELSHRHSLFLFKISTILTSFDKKRK